MQNHFMSIKWKMVIRLRLQKDVMILPCLKKNVRNILVNVKTNLTRSSKPTQAQGLCGTTHCYVDTRTGGEGGRNVWKINRRISKTSKEKIKEESFVSICGFPHREKVASNILSFFFDTSREHNLYDLFVRSLIVSIPRNK